MPAADIIVTVPPLPEGWSGTPDELLEFFTENAIFEFDGNFPTGQIGGSRPTTDVGIWYGDNSIEKFRDGKYQPISDVPVGAVIGWASVIADPPENFLFCVGQSLLRADYPELFAIIGTTWGSESGTTFTLPDSRGRGITGSGIGDYKYQGITGRMLEVTAGSYVGFEWLSRISPHPNAPTKSMRDTGALSVPKKVFARVTQPGMGMPYIIRYR